MEPSQAYSLEEQLDEMVAVGADEPIDTLIVNHPYLVFVVERGREDFALLGYDFLDTFKLIRLPQRLHEPFEQLFLRKLKAELHFLLDILAI